MRLPYPRSFLGLLILGFVLVVTPLVAGLATRTREVTAAELAGADRVAWKQLRTALEERRVERRRFRRDRDGYPKALENKLIQSRLPA